MKRYQTMIVLAMVVAAVFLITGCARPKVSGVKQKEKEAAVDTAAEKGQELFSEKGCDECHWLGDSGGEIGPELTHEGSKRDKTWLDKWLKDPASVKPDTKMPRPDLTGQERSSLVEFLSSQE